MIFLHAEYSSVYRVPDHIRSRWSAFIQNTISMKIILPLSDYLDIFKNIIAFVAVFVVDREFRRDSYKCLRYKSVDVAHMLFGFPAEGYVHISIDRVKRSISRARCLTLPTGQPSYISKIANLVKREAFDTFPRLHDSKYNMEFYGVGTNGGLI